jgi:Spy/CpxP family protein refolding chaperone
MTAAAGCGSEEPVATAASDTGIAAVPSFSEIEATVSLDADDAAVVKDALAQWRKAAADASDAGRMERHRAGMNFVATVAPSLDNAQLEDFVDFLVAYRESHMGDQGGRFQGRGERDRDRDRDRLRDETCEQLGLTAEQKAAVQALHQQTREKMREQHQAFRNGSITEEQLDQAIDALRAAQREKLAGVLSPEQMEKFDALREQHREQRMERRGDRRDAAASRHAEWLTTALALEAGQATRVRETINASTSRQGELPGSGSADRDQIRLRLRDERAACDQALREILTAAQWERLQSRRRLHPRGPHHL